MNIISYSLFGFNKERNESCFDFNTYLRGLLINIRLNRLLFPDFTIRLHTDTNTFEGFKDLFKSLPIEIVLCDSAPLTLAMLWRMKPCFDNSVSVVLCRDLDSPPTYREAQAVKYWMDKDKAAHAITDSVSHDVPMLGGMIGFKANYFKQYTGFESWEAMVNTGMDWTQKGTDQTFLTQRIYPCFAKHGVDSITQHYVLGMPNSFLSDCHNHIQDVELSLGYKESNDVCGHIGSAGFYEPPMLRLIKKTWDKFSDLNAIEKKYPNIFYWVND